MASKARDMAVRMTAWQQAEEIVSLIVSVHPLEPIRTNSPFSLVPTTTSAAEQRVVMIMDVAEWLLKRREED